MIKEAEVVINAESVPGSNNSGFLISERLGELLIG